jgi:hypothetical protein
MRILSYWLASWLDGDRETLLQKGAYADIVLGKDGYPPTLLATSDGPAVDYDPVGQSDVELKKGRPCSAFLASLGVYRSVDDGTLGDIARVTHFRNRLSLCDL